MQHHGDADARTEMLGIAGNSEQGLGGGFEQDVIDRRLILIGDVTEGSWQGEDDMVVFHRQHISLARLKPTPGRRRLTLWAVPIATRVESDLQLRAVCAAQHVTAQRGAATAFDGRHHLELPQA